MIYLLNDTTLNPPEISSDIPFDPWTSVETSGTMCSWHNGCNWFLPDITGGSIGGGYGWDAETENNRLDSLENYHVGFQSSTLEYQVLASSAK